MNAPEQPSALLKELPRGAGILVVRLRSIGDIVLLTPALRALKQWRADLRVSLLADARFRELLDMIPEVDEALTLGRSGGPAGDSRLRVLEAIRRRKFQLCLNLHGGPTSAGLTALSGAKWKAGFAHFRPQWIYNILIPDARSILRQEHIHTAEHQASALIWMGLPRGPLPGSRLVVRRADQDWWEAQRVLLDLPPDRAYAMLHPTALYPTKQWAPENFARLGRHLEREAGVAPIYSAGPGESATLESVERANQEPIRRLEGATLGQLAAAMSGARLWVGNDTGPAHMAQALGVPTAVIFGSSSSVIWGPWPAEERGRRTMVVQNAFECNPCPGDRCYRYEKPECILSVTLDQTREAIEKLLKASGRADDVAATAPRPRANEPG